MDIFLQQLINGLVLGSVYALVALGYTMVYGILGLINFAHGEVVMVGAMVVLTMINVLSSLPVPLSTELILLISVISAIMVCSILAFFMERVAYRPLRNAPRLAPLITAIGMSILLQNVAMMIWGRQYRTFPDLFTITSYNIAGANITNVQIFIVTLSVLIMIFLLLLINLTRIGRAMRATAESPAIASLMGVNVNSIISITFVIGAALAAIAGVLVSANYSVAHYSMGFVLGLKAFTAAVLGGIGNMAGAMVGGILLGLIESIGAGYISDITGGFMGSHYQDVFAFLVLIGVLVFRPTGIMGERIADRS